MLLLRVARYLGRDQVCLRIHSLKRDRLREEQVTFHFNPPVELVDRQRGRKRRQCINAMLHLLTLLRPSRTCPNLLAALNHQACVPSVRRRVLKPFSEGTYANLGTKAYFVDLVGGYGHDLFYC